MWLKWFCVLREFSSLLSILYLILTVPKCGSLSLFHLEFIEQIKMLLFFKKIKLAKFIHYSSNYFCPLLFFSSPFRTLIRYILVFLMLSTGLLSSVHFLKFSICSSYWIISIDLYISLLILSAFSDMMLNTSSECLISIIVLLDSRISIWFFL